MNIEFIGREVFCFLVLLTATPPTNSFLLVGDPRAKPPVKPKPRALPTKPALPAKPSLLVPVGPRPPRGPLAELPSARKMNMLAGPQPYGGSKRPLPLFPSFPFFKSLMSPASRWGKHCLSVIFQSVYILGRSYDAEA